MAILEGMFTAVPLGGTWSRAVWMAGIGFLGALLTCGAGRAALAASWGRATEPAKIERALRLDPNNAQLHFARGVHYLWKESAPTEAVRELRQATRLNSHAALYWAALAQACFITGEQSCVDQGTAYAVELAPNHPDYLWAAALNRLVSDRTEQAIPYLNRWLRLNPNSAEQAFDLLLPRFMDREQLWDRIVGPSRDSGIEASFLAYLVQHGDASATLSRWQGLVVTHRIDLDVAKPYLEGLLREGQYQLASSAWDSACQSGVFPADESRTQTELVVNGKFRHPPLNMGLDWRNHEERYVRWELGGEKGVPEGGKALRIELSVPDNQEYAPLYQIIPVSPGQNYELSAYMSSEAVTSDSGFRLRVVDPECEPCLEVQTEGVTGTTTWHRVMTRFATARSTRVIVLSIWRPRSRSFPFEISGRFSVTAVSLKPAPLSRAKN